MIWIAIVLSVLLLSFCIYKEWKRINRKWLTGRLVATIIAIAGLLFTIIPLYYITEHQQSQKLAVVLTDGWDKDSVQSFLNKHKEAVVYTMEENKDWNASYLPDMLLLKPHGMPLHIFGYGLSEDELSQVKGLPYQFHPTALKNTVQQITWNGSLPLGQPLRVQGNYVNSSNKTVSIVLSGFSTTLDSVVIPGKQASTFELATYPKQVGRSVFAINILQGKDTIASEPVALSVEQTKPLRLLMLSSSPDFEKKFLKNWLAEHNFDLAIKTVTTSGKSDLEFINNSNRTIGAITPSLLQNFDIVLADQKALAALSATENGALKNAVGNYGLGLLVQADSAARSSSFYGRSFAITGSGDSIQHHLKLRFNSAPTFVSLDMQYPVFIRRNDALQTVVHDESSRVFAGNILYGKGRILFTTINNSFSWQLSGQSEIYNRYWSTLINAVAPKEDIEHSWSYLPSLPAKDEPVKFSYQNETGIPSLQVAGTTLYPAQDYFLDNHWQASFWPDKVRWNPVIADGLPRGWFYVYSKMDWQGVKRARRIQQTKQYAHDNLSSGSEESKTATMRKEISPLFFLLLFLAAAGFLWYEKKRHLT